MTVSPTVDPDGEIDGLLCTATDVTEKRLFEVRLARDDGPARRRLPALRARARELRRSPSSSRTPTCATPTSTTRRPAPSPRLPRPHRRRDLPRRATPRARAAQAAGARLRDSARRPSSRSRSAASRASSTSGSRRGPTTPARSSGVLGIALDVTERRRDEQRMRLMMRELTHRSKNLLAVIQAMARKTASLSDDTDELHRRLLGAAPRDGRGARPPRLAVLARRRPRRPDPRQRRADHRARPPSRSAWRARR